LLLVIAAACDKPPEVGLPSATPQQAPASYRVRFETSKGPFVIEVTRAWAPLGADRFHQLVTASFFDNTRFFRVLDGFMAQFGAHGDPEVSKAWEALTIPDDPVVQSNKRGYISFAMAGPASRTTQVFINLVDNVNLDGMGFAPFGQVVEGMATLDSLYKGYGEGAPSGFGPDQMRLLAEGNAYLERWFPKLDFIRTARIVATGSATK
jgi:peptidyl-prolyl cis-trans isomerase A (cyclophilin A)